MRYLLAMKRMCFRLFTMFALMFPAYAGEHAVALERAETAFDRGGFQEAAELARAVASPEGYAFAARAGLVYADFLASPDDRLEIVHQAEADARRAIALAPELVEGRLQLAIALGLRGRLGGYLSAHIAGLADEVRAHLDYITTREPDNPWMQALLGGWHLEIAEAGGLLGRTLYGADVDAGIAAYRRALEVLPGDLVIVSQGALQLAALGGKIHRTQALVFLDAITVPEAPTVLQKLLMARVHSLQTALRSGDEAEIDRVVQEQKGGRAEATAEPPRQRRQARPPIGLPR